jgi:hypothetical protein
MKFDIKTDGGIIYPKSINYSGEAKDLPGEHAAALDNLFGLMDNLPTGKPNPLAADAGKYDISITSQGQTKYGTFSDTDLSSLPQDISGLLIYLKNESLKNKLGK